MTVIFNKVKCLNIYLVFLTLTETRRSPVDQVCNEQNIVCVCTILGFSTPHRHYFLIRSLRILGYHQLASFSPYPSRVNSSHYDSFTHPFFPFGEGEHLGVWSRGDDDNEGLWGKKTPQTAWKKNATLYAAFGEKNTNDPKNAPKRGKIKKESYTCFIFPYRLKANICKWFLAKKKNNKNAGNNARKNTPPQKTICDISLKLPQLCKNQKFVPKQGQAQL